MSRSIEPVYLDDSGGRHKTAEAAEAQNQVFAAIRRFERAQRELSQYMLGTATTQDGYQVNNLAGASYWQVHRYVGQKPFKREVWIWPHDCTVLTGSDGTLSYRGESGTEKPIFVRLDSLFAHEHNANRRYLQLLHEFKAEIQDEIEQCEARGFGK